LSGNRPHSIVVTIRAIGVFEPSEIVLIVAGNGVVTVIVVGIGATGLGFVVGFVVATIEGWHEGVEVLGEDFVPFFGRVDVNCLVEWVGIVSEIVVLVIQIAGIPLPVECDIFREGFINDLSGNRPHSIVVTIRAIGVFEPGEIVLIVAGNGVVTVIVVGIGARKLGFVVGAIVGAIAGAIVGAIVGTVGEGWWHEGMEVAWEELGPLFIRVDCFFVVDWVFRVTEILVLVIQIAGIPLPEKSNVIRVVVTEKDSGSGKFNIDIAIIAIRVFWPCHGVLTITDHGVFFWPIVVWSGARQIVNGNVFVPLEAF
jgi:hypothetical protein